MWAIFYRKRPKRYVSSKWFFHLIFSFFLLKIENIRKLGEETECFERKEDIVLRKRYKCKMEGEKSPGDSQVSY